MATTKKATSPAAPVNGKPAATKLNGKEISARASGTPEARETARHALAHNYPVVYPREIRQFFYMPFQHSEDLGDQNFCCTLFSTLGNPDGDRHAREHRDIVARFGRFPHRNEVLGRECTAEELDYLKTAKRFGQ